jgi:molybdopterin-guanine dinucleotide biosynthesis protein B
MCERSQESDTSRTTPVISVVGHSGSGKTTLLEKLIRELRLRGYRLAVIKHHHHRGIQLDERGKDTWRFAQAGADHVVLAGPDKLAHLRAFAPSQEPTLEEIASSIRGVDLILTEGYKHAHAPKIEISRGQTKPTLISDPSDLLAIVSDLPLSFEGRDGIPAPQFGLEDVKRLADLIQTRFLAPIRSGYE